MGRGIVAKQRTGRGRSRDLGYPLPGGGPEGIGRARRGRAGRYRQAAPAGSGAHCQGRHSAQTTQGRGEKESRGRKTTQAAVDSVGQGRVWSGADAIKINLVDELGGINEAIAYAAKQAKLSEYKIQSLPKQKDPIEELLGNTKEEIGTRVMQENLGIQYQYLKQVKNVLMLKGVQARLPYEMVIE